MNEDAPLVATFESAIATDIDFVPAVIFAFKTPIENCLVGGSDAGTSVPFSILISVCVLAQKYMLNAVYLRAIDSIKERIAACKSAEDVDGFQDIIVAAAGANITTVVMAALDTAKEFGKLRKEYEAGNLRGEAVQHLMAIWPAITAPTPSKRRRHL